MVTNADNPTVGAARAAFFRDNGFPSDGGYDDEHAEAEFGPLRYRVKSSKARGDALRVHDLHHVATGYPTDWRGEAEISAWELGSRLGTRFPYAWITVLFGVFSGIVAHLGPTFRAFVRGRRSQNLYGDRFDAAWLDRRLSTLRAELRLEEETPRAKASDALAFVGWSVVAAIFGVVALPFVAWMVFDGMRPRACEAPCPVTALLGACARS